MKKLPPYNSVAKCSKCGHDAAAVIYCSNSSKSYVNGEYLKRKCWLCGYGWIEACLDKDNGNG
ncbi:unnamed protein product [marine sediment metagenome]|uniref:Uncharacterized protein n=1 Tax=marine sediment metagenome TaxID=412755 RepID=X0TPD8_9ZZZZ